MVWFALVTLMSTFYGHDFIVILNVMKCYGSNSNFMFTFGVCRAQLQSLLCLHKGVNLQRADHQEIWLIFYTYKRKRNKWGNIHFLIFLLTDEIYFINNI